MKVKVGDKIKTEDGIVGIVTHLLETEEGRYLICFKENKHPHYFVEGDKEFKVVE